MPIVRWDPLRSLREDDFFRAWEPWLPARRDADGGPIVPAVDVSTTDGEIKVTMEVPGIDKDKLDVTVTDTTVSVRGEIREEKEKKEKDYHRREIRFGSFERTVPLPIECDPAKANAELANGRLTITAPKSAKAQSKKVAVAVH